MWHFNLTAVSGCVCQSASTMQAETWCGWSVFYYIFTSHRTGNWTHGLFAQLQLQPSFFIILRQDLPKSLSCPGWAVTWYSSASASGRIKGGHAMPSLVSVLKCVLACVGWMCAYASVVQQCVFASCFSPRKTWWTTVKFMFAHITLFYQLHCSQFHF